MELQQSKHNLDMIFMIGLSAGESICDSLRSFYNTIKYHDLHSGDSIFNHYKDLEGKFFQNEAKFMLHNKTKKNQDIINVAVSNSEIREFEKLCRDYGVDILYMKRPDNLEELLSMDQQGVDLTNNQKNILKAFTYKDDDGIHIKKDASLICFNTADIDVVERVLDRLEEKTLSIEKRRQRAEDILSKLKKAVPAKNIEKGKEV